MASSQCEYAVDLCERCLRAQVRRQILDRWQGSVGHLACYASQRTRPFIDNDEAVCSNCNIHHWSYVGIDHADKIKCEISVCATVDMLV
jgi:hypothetical protein